MHTLCMFTSFLRFSVQNVQSVRSLNFLKLRLSVTVPARQRHLHAPYSRVLRRLYHSRKNIDFEI